MGVDLFNFDEPISRSFPKVVNLSQWLETVDGVFFERKVASGFGAEKDWRWRFQKLTEGGFVGWKWDRDYGTPRLADGS